MQPTPDSTAVLALLALPFLAAALTPVVFRLIGERTAYFAAAVALACFGLVASLYGSHGAVAYDWIPELGIAFRVYVDGLSILMGFLASGIGVLILSYSRGYMHGESNQMKFYATLLAFMGSMLGVVFSADLIVLFVFWELTSLTSFLLIGHYQRTRSSRYAARKSMLITVSGGLFMLVGFLLLHGVTDTFDLVLMLENPEQVRALLRESGLYLPVLGLIAVGAATKSAQVPFHVWLPNAMEAPTPVSAFLHSATMVKAGVYLIGRLRPVLLNEHEWLLLFATLGLATMTVAAILAVAATDIKELLAYSTASHLGLIVAGFGFASFLGAETGAFHILNHATFKAALFLVAGIVAHEAGTRRISELGGLRRDLPITAAITAVAALSMAGVPPFNGFYSKELLFEAAYEAAHHLGGVYWLYPAVAVLGSVFTFLYSVRFLMLFFGAKPKELGHVHSPPRIMLVPPLILAAAALVISAGGVTATFGVHLPVEGFVAGVVESVAAGDAGHGEFSYYLPTHLSPAAIMSAITIGVGLVAYRFYGSLHRGINRFLAGAPVLRANWWYDGGVAGLNRTSAGVMPVIQNGLLRTYAAWTLGTVSVLTLAAYAATNVSLPAFEGLSVATPILLVLLVAVVGALAVETASSHVAGVLTLSILGFMVAVFYVLASAPDLALTQLVVETLSLVIFVLVLNKLPSFYGETLGTRAIRDGVLSIAVGATVFLTVLVTTAAHPADGIAHYFVEEAIPQGGGGNVVNVILVDFRGFDTLGEITVVAMAALSILTLVAMRERGELQ